ncbi:MAG: hypothetical protein RLZZ383_2491 [Pseudomonadota bacterium]|jgi:hypothetical protein
MVTHCGETADSGRGMGAIRGCAVRWTGALVVMASCVTQRTLVKLSDDAGPATDTAPAAGDAAVAGTETSEPPSAPSTSEEPAQAPVETGAPVGIDTAGSTPSAPADSGDTGCGPTSWAQASFAFPQDALSCSGPQWVRYDATAGLWVGVVGCAQGFLRIYLAPSASGPFVQATDLAGHGQDHCALIVPGWTLPNEDDITSGGCATCATSVNLPIEGAPTYARAFLGQPWTFYPASGAWSWQTSRLFCGDVPAACGP